MRSALPSPAAAPPDPLDALAHFTERRRQSFVESFASQCDVILNLIDQVAARGARGPVLTLRQYAHRISALAALVGFTHASISATALEHVIGDGIESGFDAALAKDLVGELRAACSVDVAAQAPPAKDSAATRIGVEAPPSLHMLIVDDHALL